LREDSEPRPGAELAIWQCLWAVRFRSFAHFRLKIALRG
jgi:hypothetical protein